MDWEEYISEIASDILKEQSPKRFAFDTVYRFLIFHDKQNVSLNLEVVSFTNSLPYNCFVNQSLLFSNKIKKPISFFCCLRAMHLSSLHVICFRLFQVRGKLYELLINCIPPEIILKVNVLLDNVAMLVFFFLL